MILLATILASPLANATVVHPTDPGRCGVSVSGPTGDGHNQFAYLVRNQCSVPVRLAVYQYTILRYAHAVAATGGHCQVVAAFGYAYYTDSVGDRTWQAVSC